MNESEILEIKGAFEKNAAANAAALAAVEQKSARALDLAEKAAANQFELEQEISEKMAFAGHRMETKHCDSLASQLIANAQIQGVACKASTKTAVEIKAGDLLLETKNISYDTGVSFRQALPEIAVGASRRTWLRNRFRQINVVGSTVEFHRLASYSNNAAPQYDSSSPARHEGVLKAESTLTFEQVEKKVATIAHFVKASRQVLSDVSMLQLTLDTQLRYGLELAVESQILTGSGTGANLSGLTASGNHTAFTPTSGDTALDSLSRALAAIEAADGTPDLVVLHPTDFRAMQRLKSSGGGDFLFGAPNGSNAPSVWNTSVHVTPSMSAGSFIAMDSALACALFVREDASIVAGLDGDDFTKNLVTLLGECRLCLGVLNPSMIRYGSLTQ